MDADALEKKLKKIVRHCHTNSPPIAMPSYKHTLLECDIFFLIPQRPLNICSLTWWSGLAHDSHASNSCSVLDVTRLGR